MALLGAETEQPKCQIQDPESRKDVVTKRLLQNAVEIGDWTLTNFVLKHCWEKERTFMYCRFENCSLLHVATTRNFVRTVRVLIEHGIDLDTVDSCGNTCLHIAVTHGFKNVIELLCEGGCNPFIENIDLKQAIDLSTEQCIKEHLQEYHDKSSQIKIMKNLTWETIEDDKKDGTEIVQQKEDRNTSLEPQPVTESTVDIKRADSGIISDDADSEKSISSQKNTPSPIPRTHTFTSQSTMRLARGIRLPGMVDMPDNYKNNNNNGKIHKSRSFSIKDVASQYNNVTAAIRKISGSRHSGIKEVSVAEENSGIVEKDTENEKKIEKKNSEKSSMSIGGKIHKLKHGGLKVSAMYDVQKKMSTLPRKQIDRRERKSLPLLPTHMTNPSVQ